MDRPALKPPFAYYGGKTTLAPMIANLLPEHEHYVEPFAGGLSVLLAKPRSACETVNDLDGDLVNFWRVLRDQPEDLARACRLTPYARAELDVAGSLDGITDLERARRVWVRLNQSRTNSMRDDGARGSSWRRSIGGQTRLSLSIANHAERILPLAERLDGVHLESRDALDVIREYGVAPSVCLYIDPPYLGETRASGYRHELLGREQHEALAEVMHDCRAAVVLSGYDSPLYEALFGDWHRVEVKGPPTMQAHATDRIEVLWSNRPLGEPDLFSFGDGAA